MRFSLALAVVVLGISVSGLAQSTTYKIKPSHAEKAPKSSAPPPAHNAPGEARSSNTSSKDLQNLEHQTAKNSALSPSGVKKTPGTTAASKPIKDKPNPPINVGSSGGKSAGTLTQASNPYKGRLKQKHGQ